MLGNGIYTSIDIYTMKKNELKSEENIHYIDKDFKSTVKLVFNKYDYLIFIMATGIVIRSIKDLISDKSKDPAIIVADEKGVNIISLLSGHIGGANYMSEYIGELINARPIITTATDINNKLAPDILLLRYNLKFKDFKALKNMTRDILDDEKVYIYSDTLLEEIEDKSYIFKDQLEDIKKENNIIIISNKHKQNFSSSYKNMVIARAKNLVVGIGCKKNKSFEEIYDKLKYLFNINNLSMDSIRIFSTIDVKKSEKGLINLANHFKKDIKIINRDDVLKIEDDFNGSDFVKKTIGVKSVCEPTAYIASKKNGRMLVNKTSLDGITIAVYEEKITFTKTR